MGGRKLKFFHVKTQRGRNAKREKRDEEKVKKRGTDIEKISRELDSVNSTAAAATGEECCFISLVDIPFCGRV